MCNAVVCLCVCGQRRKAESRPLLYLHTHLLIHSLTCLPSGFHRHSARAKLNTDWFLQTDAEGDTHSLINWPSRYTQAGHVPPPESPAMFPFSWISLNAIKPYEQCFLNCRSGQDPVLLHTTPPPHFHLSFRVTIHSLYWGS